MELDQQWWAQFICLNKFLTSIFIYWFKKVKQCSGLLTGHGELGGIFLSNERTIETNSVSRVFFNNTLFLFCICFTRDFVQASYHLNSFLYHQLSRVTEVMNDYGHSGQHIMPQSHSHGGSGYISTSFESIAASWSAGTPISSIWPVEDFSGSEVTAEHACWVQNISVQLQYTHEHAWVVFIT